MRPDTKTNCKDQWKYSLVRIHAVSIKWSASAQHTAPSVVFFSRRSMAVNIGTTSVIRRAMSTTLPDIPINSISTNKFRKMEPENNPLTSALRFIFHFGIMSSTHSALSPQNSALENKKAVLLISYQKNGHFSIFDYIIQHSAFRTQHFKNQLRK